jgi:tRNA (adenine57-N1/adenine58-N1)-methyltransferase
MSFAREGDVVLLVSQERKRYLIRLRAGESFYSHKGAIEHNALIGQPLGRTVYTQYNYAYLALEPSTNDLLQQLPRASQIIYGKDAAHIALRLNLFAGRTVVEAGTGSGGLTMVLARAVMPTGRVYSYETRPESFEMATRNLETLGLLPYITLYNEDISGGFHETDVDACFLDVREPWVFLKQAWDTLKGSGFFGALLLREYKPVPARLRPEDRMLAHSAFMVFARKLAPGDVSLKWVQDKKRRTYLAKLAMEAEVQRRAEHPEIQYGGSLSSAMPEPDEP